MQVNQRCSRMKKEITKFLLVGLPRSGTTIFANFIHSSKNAFCFLEPHWEHVIYKGSTKFLRDNKLRLIYGLKYLADESLPLDKVLDNISKRYPFCGIKETFRSDCYLNISPDIVNNDLLQHYKDAGYLLVPIIRNPLNVWNSFQRKNPPAGSWPDRLDLFIENYCRFFSFIGDAVPVVYEKFVEDAASEFSKKVSVDLGVNKIQTRKSKMGDRDARHSTVISFIKRDVCYLKADKKAIEKSDAMKLYKEFAANNG